MPSGIGQGLADLFSFHLLESPGPNAVEVRGWRRIQDLSAGEDELSFQKISKLSEVAGPGMLPHPLQSPGSEAGSRPAEPFGQVGQDEISQGWEILSSLSQRR
jgi:hypothetical protein